MNIAIDIDDTLTESFSYFQPYVAEFFQTELQELAEKGISYSNLPPAWKAEEIRFCRTYYDRVAADTPFKEGASRAVKRLRELGHRILVITARSTELYTDPYRTTREELAKGDIPYDALICTFDKAEACRKEGVSLLIDDHPANCAAAAKQGIQTLLFSSPANQEEKAFARVENWEEALAWIEKMEDHRKEAGAQTGEREEVFEAAREGEEEAAYGLILARVSWMAEKGIDQWPPIYYEEIYPLSYYRRQREQKKLYVCRRNGKVTAAAVLLETDERWPDQKPAYYVHNFAAAAEEKGAGSRFLHCVEDLARQKGKEAVRLDCSIHNRTLNEYYEKQGYCLAGRCEEGGYVGNRREKALS